MRKIVHLVTFIVASGLFAHAQDAPKTEKPKTKLETFLVQDGAVIVQGYTTVGVAKAMLNSSVIVDSKEIFNANTGKKEYGITIEVKQLSNSKTSYIDYDEIESLIKGLDYISKIDKTATTLDSFQADYKTKGDLKFSVFNRENGNVNLAVTSGTIGALTAYFRVSDIVQVRDLISKAKEKLDSIKK